MLSRRMILKSAFWMLVLAGCRQLSESPMTPTIGTAKPSPTLPPPSPTLLPSANPTITVVPQYAITSSSRIIAVASGPLIRLALRADGRVYGWGDASMLGLSGTSVNTPTLLEDVEDIEAISIASYHSIFIQDGHLIQRNFYRDGKLGVIDGIDDIVKVSSDFESLVALRSDGTLWGYGDNQYGQLGIGKTSRTDKFVQVPIDNVIGMTTGDWGGAAIDVDGAVWEWGGSQAVTRGLVDIIDSPQLIPEFSNIVEIGMGRGLAGVDANGGVSILFVNEVIRFTELPFITHVKGNGDTSYGLLLARDGTLWGWGDAWVEFGMGLTQAPPTGPDWFAPKQVPVSNVVDFACGSLALDSDGTVWALGYGYLGDEPQITPVPIIHS